MLKWYANKTRASGGIGRRTGLKILGVMNSWGFESPLAHHADVACLALRAKADGIVGDVLYVYTKKLDGSKNIRGAQSNMKKRLLEHNVGKSCFSSRYKPWKLIYKESFRTLTESINREKYLKSAAGRRWIKKYIFKNNRADVAELVDAQP